MTKSALFEVVPEKDYLSLYPEGKVDYGRVVDFLKLKSPEVAKATGIPKSSVRYDEKIPAELKERLLEWAALLNLVAEYFEGDADKTTLWFQIPNPLLGGIKPRDMIRFGRAKRLWSFVVNAIEENEPQ